MPVNSSSSRLDQLHTRSDDILARWIAEQKASGAARPDLISEADLGRQCSEVLSAFLGALGSGSTDVMGPAWEGMRSSLRSVSTSRARSGWKPSETVLFVLSLKYPVIDLLEKSANLDEVIAIERLIDRLALFTADLYQQGREDVILRQQSELLELSTPVVKLWEGVLALPIIGTLDSERTQVVMETLLKALVDTGSTIAILDITGVPTVDTRVAQHLIQTVSAARLMGAECFISGIRPQIAQTIVHLGVALPDVTTKATLADAFAAALGRLGRAVVPAGSGSMRTP